MNYLDLYSSLVETNALLPKPKKKISDEISFFKTAMTSESSDPEECTTRYYKVLSSAIYGLADAIQDRVADLDKISLYQGKSLGITNSSKAKVFLLGETSAGKTTFLQRMFGESCGQTGASPITAFTVIHKITEQKSHLEVSFKESFRVDTPPKDDFVRFLKKYGFYDGFKITGNEFSTQEEHTMSDKNEFINFIYEANHYPFAFEEITWHHKKSTKQIGFLNYADIFDMPGSGGQTEHDGNLESALRKYNNDRIDIILYLIKPDQGIPSSYEYLKTLRSLINIQPKPQIFFVYEIHNKSDFKEITRNLHTFITKEEGTDAIGPFNQIEQDFYLDAHVLDARGDKNNSIKADIALAAVIQRFYLIRTKEFLDSIFISKVPKEYEVMNAGKPTVRGVNSLLDEFLEGWTLKHGEDGKLPSIKKMKEEFINKFALKEEFDFTQLPGDLKITLIKLRQSIFEDIEDVFSYLKMSPRTIEWIKNNHLDEKFDKTKYEEVFWEQYREKADWQRLIYNIQAFHWLRLNYTDNSIKDIYAKQSAEPVIAYLKEYIERLGRIHNVMPVISPLSSIEIS